MLRIEKRAKDNARAFIAREASLFSGTVRTNSLQSGLLLGVVADISSATDLRSC